MLPIVYSNSITDSIAEPVGMHVIAKRVFNPSIDDSSMIAHFFRFGSSLGSKRNNDIGIFCEEITIFIDSVNRNVERALFAYHWKTAEESDRCFGAIQQELTNILRQIGNWIMRTS